MNFDTLSRTGIHVMSTQGGQAGLSARLSSSCYDAVVVEEALLWVMVAALVYN